MSTRDALIAAGKIKPAPIRFPGTEAVLNRLNAPKMAPAPVAPPAEKKAPNPPGAKAVAKLEEARRLAARKKNDQAEQGRFNGEKKASK